jgi:hypothetical protein
VKWRFFTSYPLEVRDLTSPANLLEPLLRWQLCCRAHSSVQAAGLSRRSPFARPKLIVEFLVTSGVMPKDLAESILRKANPPEQVLETGVRANGAEPRIYFEENEIVIALLISLFEPLECLIVGTKAYIEYSDDVRRDELLLRKLR